MVENGSFRVFWENVTITKCAVNSFSEFLCYAATYFPETGICVAEYTDIDIVPENVTLVNFTINSTVLLRTYNKGIAIQKPLQDIHTVYPKSSTLFFNLSTEDLQQKITQIKKILTVVKTSLSSSQRKLVSAPQERQSSVTIGILGTYDIIGTLFALVGSDLFKFFMTVNFLKRKF